MYTGCLIVENHKITIAFFNRFIKHCGAVNDVWHWHHDSVYEPIEECDFDNF